MLLYVKYFSFQMKRFMSRLCPGGKMSCIGNYQRNVLNFTTTVKLALAWGFFPMFRQVVMLAYAHLEEQVSPRHVFYIDTVLWILFSDVFYTYLNLRLKSRGIPSITEVPRPTNFSDLSKNNLALEGRRAIVDNGNKRRRPYPRKQTLPVGRMDLPTMAYQAAEEGSSKTGVFERFTEESKRLPHKFSYFSKLQRGKKPTTVADIGGKKENLEIWHQAVDNSPKRILLYSRHMNDVNPETENI